MRGMARNKQKRGTRQGYAPPEISDELPSKPEHWSPKITGFRNTYNEDRTDWQPLERERPPQLHEENAEIAERLAARMAAWREDRAAAASARDEY